MNSREHDISPQKPAATQQNEWQSLHDGFMQLADEQERIVRATRKDFLFADCEFAGHEFYSLQQGPCCFLPTIESATLLDLREGPDEHLKVQFEVLATRAAKALGCPRDVPPLRFWLFNLFLNLQRAKSPHLFAPTGEVTIGDNPRSDLLKPLAGRTFYPVGGIITNVCTASAVFCSRLERKALEAEEAAEGSADTPVNKSTNAAADKTREEFMRPILEKKGFSIHDWASKARVDFHTADNYLKGKTKPYPATLKKLADALGVEVAKLPE